MARASRASLTHRHATDAASQRHNPFVWRWCRKTFYGLSESAGDILEERKYMQSCEAVHFQGQAPNEIGSRFEACSPAS